MNNDEISGGASTAEMQGFSFHAACIYHYPYQDLNFWSYSHPESAASNGRGRRRRRNRETE